MTVKLPEGSRSALAEKNDDHQPNDDQTDDKIPLPVIDRVIHSYPPQGFAAVSSSIGIVI